MTSNRNPVVKWAVRIVTFPVAVCLWLLFRIGYLTYKLIELVEDVWCN